MFKKTIKIMADYNSHGLWSPNYDIDTEKLYESLTEKLQNKIKLWISVYSEQINWDSPGDTNWVNMNNLLFWKELLIKEELTVKSIITEVGGKYKIEYVPTDIPKQFREELKELIDSQKNLLKKLERGEFNPITK